MKYFCNPLNVDYRYQFNQQVMPGLGEGAIEVSREAADPSMIYFKGKYEKRAAEEYVMNRQRADNEAGKQNKQKFKKKFREKEKNFTDFRRFL